MKKVVRLTEGQLKQIIENQIKEIDNRNKLNFKKDLSESWPGPPHGQLDPNMPPEIFITAIIASIIIYGGAFLVGNVDWENIKYKTLNVLKKLGRTDIANKLENTDDETMNQKVNQIKQNLK